MIGPAADIGGALSLFEEGQRIDGAVLDVSLQGEMAFPVPGVLKKRGIPFVFATGYNASTIPARYAEVPRCEKPVRLAEIVRALFG